MPAVGVFAFNGPPTKKQGRPPTVGAFMFRSRKSALRKILSVALATCCLLAVAAAQDPSVTGQWSAVMTWPTANSGWVPTHAMLMSDGRVLYDGSYGDGLTPHIFDPATNSVTTAAKP